MTVKIENAVDGRTQRTNKDPRASASQRERRNKSSALGLCNKCHKEPVDGKKNCKDCIEKNRRSTERYTIKKYGLPMPVELRLSHELTGIDYQCNPQQ